MVDDEGIFYEESVKRAVGRASAGFGFRCEFRASLILWRRKFVVLKRIT